MKVETWKQNLPGTPILLWETKFSTSAVWLPGCEKKLVPSPASNPTWAGTPPSPLTPSEASPVVHVSCV